MFHVKKELWWLIETLLVYFVSPELGSDAVTGRRLLHQRHLDTLIWVVKGWQLEP